MQERVHMCHIHTSLLYSQGLRPTVARTRAGSQTWVWRHRSLGQESGGRAELQDR